MLIQLGGSRLHLQGLDPPHRACQISKQSQTLNDPLGSTSLIPKQTFGDMNPDYPMEVHEESTIRSSVLGAR